jgi:hypothetical protein
MLLLRPLIILLLTVMLGGAVQAAPAAVPLSGHAPAQVRLQKRWLFYWRTMSDPQVVDRVIADFPRAQADGYNAVVFGYDVAPSRAAAFKQAARRHGLGLVAMVMGGAHDRNDTEGVLSQDALFVARGGAATFQPDNPTRVVNGGFEDARGNHFNGWGFQDDEGTTTFADHQVTHGGKTSLRMENIGKNPAQYARIEQPIRLQPHRQYRVSFWVKTEGLAGPTPEVKVLAPDGSGISYGTFHCDRTQDWRHYDLVFNSLNNTDANLYLGSWYGKDGNIWWDDLSVDEIGLVNVLRRPGCPVTVKGEDGTVYAEGRDYEKIVDPRLNPWQAYHDPPVLRLTASTRIPDGAHLRVSYYHPVIIYEDRITACLSEPRVFDDWRAEVETANRLYHPDAFLMQHDEMRVIDQCALCQSRHLTPGALLADNVHRGAAIIRKARPDAGIWVWSDMFDPKHNAVDSFYLVNGSLKGSWKGLDKDVGIVNWNGGLAGKNCRFFADLGLRQILSGYYDADNDGAGITGWLANARDVPGVVGAMYTTWGDNYGAMDVWAQKAWGQPSPPAKPPLTPGR